MRAAVALLALTTLASACGGAIRSRYALAGYDALAPGAIKRIAVAGWAPASHADVAPLAAQVAADFVKLRKNYLVHPPVAEKRDFAEACAGVEGVLEVRVLELATTGDEVTARVEASLFRCGDGALLWRTEGGLAASSRDVSLEKLAEAYRTRAGESAARFAAPLFAILQQLLGPLPDPVLTDDEVTEKIELG